MTEKVNPTSVSPILFVIAPVLLALVSNALIYWLKLLRPLSSSPESRWGLPPGWVVGTIWTLLFGTLGYVLFLTYNANGITAVGVAIFIALCLAYPFYVRSQSIAPIANLATLLLGFTVTIIIARTMHHISAVTWMIPVLAWLSYVCTLDSLRIRFHMARAN